MGNRLLHLLFGSLAIAGCAALCFLLWTYDYALAYRWVFKTWDVFKYINAGQWTAPAKQAMAYQDNAGIQRATAIASVAVALEFGALVLAGSIIIFQPFRRRAPGENWGSPQGRLPQWQAR